MAVAVRKNAVTELFWKVHRWLYRASGGRIGGKVVGMPVLLLTTKGRKTGAPRSSVLTYVPQGDAMVVYASYAGEPRHPAWWLNLLADPHATVQRGQEVVPVVPARPKARRGPRSGTRSCGSTPATPSTKSGPPVASRSSCSTRSRTERTVFRRRSAGVASALARGVSVPKPLRPRERASICRPGFRTSAHAWAASTRRVCPWQRTLAQIVVAERGGFEGRGPFLLRTRFVAP
jgi:deazaflavin-dependent oxidoreductase (nitroreductase family)